MKHLLHFHFVVFHIEKTEKNCPIIGESPIKFLIEKTVVLSERQTRPTKLATLINYIITFYYALYKPETALLEFQGAFAFRLLFW